MTERTQTESAYQELRRRILILELVPNGRLKETEWAGKLGVSRFAIRESLTRLQGEELVYQGDRGGYFVAELSESDIHELKEVREVLEAAAFVFACDRATSKQIRDLEETCGDFANMVKKGYLTGACETDLRFHHLLLAASGNSRLAQMYHRSNIPLFHMKLGRSRIYMDDFADTEKEHRMIVEALRKKDKAHGVELLKSHFNRGLRGVLNDNSEQNLPTRK